MKRNTDSGRHEHPLPQEISNTDRDAASRAHDTAENDIAADPDLQEGDRTDDLDEGELARLGDDNPGI